MLSPNYGVLGTAFRVTFDAYCKGGNNRQHTGVLGTAFRVTFETYFKGGNNRRHTGVLGTAFRVTFDVQNKMKKQCLSVACLIFIIGNFFACKNTETEQDKTGSGNEPALFTLLNPEKTHVDFQNNITEGLNTNVLMYEYFYNGGGVSVGDINNDGLDDIYFTSNMQSNRLYLNKGGLRASAFANLRIVLGRGACFPPSMSAMVAVRRPADFASSRCVNTRSVRHWRR